MIVGIGVDIVNNARIAKAIARYGEHYLKRVFTLNEIRQCQKLWDPIVGYSNHFASKEALLKAIGTGWSGNIQWTNMELLYSENNVPKINSTGELQRILSEKGINCIKLSIGKTKEYSIATVILESLSMKN